MMRGAELMTPDCEFALLVGDPVTGHEKRVVATSPNGGAQVV